MAGRRLDPDGEALWARVKASVRPMPGREPARVTARAAPIEARTTIPAAKPQASIGHAPTVSRPPTKVAAKPSNTLDGGWDKRLIRGVVSPDSTLDLHGHTLRSAHAMLDAGLDRAIARGDRVMLLVTGKPPRAESERPHARGAIRAQVTDWIAGSRHAGRIAAVRGAHPRHGGQGALYLIFRRSRTQP